MGSGLAASSSYLIAMIHAISRYEGIPITDAGICRLALRLEREFNPLTGQQDPYGCGMPGFKRMFFNSSMSPKFEYYDASFLDNFQIYLFPTMIPRSSTSVLKTVDIDRVHHSYQLVHQMHASIESRDINKFLHIINKGWENKKKTSSHILSNQSLLSWDDSLIRSEYVLAHRLCGAGGGGYFAIFTTPGTVKVFDNEDLNNQLIPVNVNIDGARTREL